MHQLLRRLKAFVVLTMLWGLFSGLGFVLVDLAVSLIGGSVSRGRWPDSIWAFEFGAVLGLAFGAAFSITLGLLGRLFRSGRVPTWAAALLGGIGAPLGGTILLSAAHSIFLGPALVVGMAVFGVLIGGGIGAVSNRAALPPGSAPVQLPGKAE